MSGEARNDWNTPMPPLGEITAACNELAITQGIDVAEVRVVLNGQHGGWDVTLIGTDEDMQDVTLPYVLHRYGALEKV